MIKRKFDKNKVLCNSKEDVAKAVDRAGEMVYYGNSPLVVEWNVKDGYFAKLEKVNTDDVKAPYNVSGIESFSHIIFKSDLEVEKLN